MQHKYYLFESLAFAFIAVILDFNSNIAIETIFLNLIGSLIIISLNTIVSRSYLLIGLNSLAAVFILFTGFGLNHLVILAYLLSHSIQYWALIAVIFLFLIEPLPVYTMIVTACAVYIGQKSQINYHILKDLNSTRDNLQAKQLELKASKHDLIHSKQKDIDIAILSERNRISEDLHDAVGHSLARSIIQIDAIQIINDNDKVDQQLNQLQESLRQGMNNIRSTIHQLHQESLDLHTSIAELQRELSPLNITFDELNKHPLTYPQKIDLLSVIKEAIYNSVKHSNATKVSIVLQSFPQHVKLMIKDNGSNYDKKKVESEGIGKTMMRQIANKYNAKLMSHYQKGYIVILNIPVKSL